MSEPEDAEDVAAAREALARIESGDTPIPLDELVAEIDPHVRWVP